MDEAFITGDVLRWARERRNLSQAELAKKLKITANQVQDWESGKTYPQFTKAEKLATQLKIPFSYLFFSTAPPDDTPLPDLRTLSGEAPRTLSPDFIEQINSVLRKQDWYREYAEMHGKAALPFVGKFSTDNAPEAVAASITQTLGIDTGLRRQAHSWENYFSKMVNRAEQKGVLVIRSGIVKSSSRRPLSVQEFQGFASSDDLAPIVFVNGRDSVAARIFTLLHELAHIWLAKSGISNADGIDQQHTIPLEKFCNSVTVEALVPMAEFDRLWEVYGRSGEPIARLATAFRVSGRVIVRRAFSILRRNWIKQSKSMPIQIVKT